MHFRLSVFVFTDTQAPVLFVTSKPSRLSLMFSTPPISVSSSEFVFFQCKYVASTQPITDLLLDTLRSPSSDLDNDGYHVCSDAAIPGEEGNYSLFLKIIFTL